MSDAVGPIAIGDREQEIFLGREIVQRREISERTAELVDAEVKRILGAAYERAREIITARRDVLDRLAQALLERETLDHGDVDLVVAGKPLPPQAPSPAPTPTPAPDAGARRKPQSARPVLRHPPPARRPAPPGRHDRTTADLEGLIPELVRLFTAWADPPRVWRIAGAELPLAEPLLIGILNVTPDSFSDGGRFASADAALAQGERLKADGAGLLDVGGESTRPGARAVPVPEEIARVVPVVRALLRHGLRPVAVARRKTA